MFEIAYHSIKGVSRKMKYWILILVPWLLDTPSGAVPPNLTLMGLRTSSLAFTALTISIAL